MVCCIRLPMSAQGTSGSEYGRITFEFESTCSADCEFYFMMVSWPASARAFLRTVCVCHAMFCTVCWWLLLYYRFLYVLSNNCAVIDRKRAVICVSAWADIPVLTCCWFCWRCRMWTDGAQMWLNRGKGVQRNRATCTSWLKTRASPSPGLSSGPARLMMSVHKHTHTRMESMFKMVSNAWLEHLSNSVATQSFKIRLIFH